MDLDLNLGLTLGLTLLTLNFRPGIRSYAWSHSIRNGKFLLFENFANLMAMKLQQTIATVYKQTCSWPTCASSLTISGVEGSRLSGPGRAKDWIGTARKRWKGLAEGGEACRPPEPGL